jgi:hypothetical protein
VGEDPTGGSPSPDESTCRQTVAQNIMTLREIEKKARRAPYSSDAAIYDKQRNNAAILWRSSRWPQSDFEAQSLFKSAVNLLRNYARRGIHHTFGSP